tara:strand:- start:428 stop:778 length:351 start_codon:yes stop_codon:yes gene_type:complete
MPERIFNAQKGTYQSGPIKLIGNLHWDNWRLRLIMDEPEFYLYNNRVSKAENEWLDSMSDEVNGIDFRARRLVISARKRWKRQTLMYKLTPILNVILATLPIQLILIPMKIMVITW